MKLRITSIDHVLMYVRYLNASSKGGTEIVRLPILQARVAELPDELDAIVACSDLQGIVPDDDGRAELLGVEVARVLEGLAYDGTIPSLARTGVILAGDMYCVPEANKRGGFGLVAPAWNAFADRCAWVTGVAGNHDDMRGVKSALDGEVVDYDGIRIGGVGYIIGNKQKPGRRGEDEQVRRIERVIGAGVDVLVLHEGPNGDAAQQGNPMLRELIEAAGVPLTICGHCYWREPLATHDNGQLLNVDGRVVILTE